MNAETLVQRWRSKSLLVLWLVLSGLLFYVAHWEASRQEQVRLAAFRGGVADLVEISEAIMASRLKAYDNTLLALREAYVSHPSNFDAHVKWLRSGPLVDRDLLAVVVDHKGYLAYTDAPNAKPGLYLGDRPYFRNFLEGGKDRFYIDEPIFGRTTKRYSVPLVRPIYGTQGEFLGVVALSIRQDSLGDFGQRMKLRQGTAVTVVTRRGALVTRTHDLAKGQGTNIEPDLLSKLSERQDGVFASAAANGEPHIVAYRHIENTPLIVYVSASAAPVLQDTATQRDALLASAAIATFLGLLLTLAYLQHQKITGKYVATQQAYLKEAQRIAGMGSWELDLTSNTFQFSDEVYRIFGIPPGEATYRLKHFLALVTESDRSAVAEAFERTRVEGSQRMEFHLQRGDGQVRLMVGRGEALRNPAGKITALIGTVRDVTERRKAEEQLRIAATTFDSQEGMLVTNADSVILKVNQAFTETTGYTAEELVGQTPGLFKSGRHDEDFYAEMWQRIARTGKWQGEVWDRHKSGRVFPKWLTISAVKDADGKVTHYVGTHTDITERKEAEDKIRQLAFFDSLTGLPNRSLLFDRLKQAMTTSARSGSHNALLFIDLDNFKTLNDTQGHDKGDMLLQQIAERLTASVREGDSVTRLGGDEFVVMLTGLSETLEEAAAQTETIGGKILVTLSQTYSLGNVAYRSTASVGVTLFSGQTASIDDLLKQADLAMYKAKDSGRNALRFFDPAMEASVLERSSLEIDLREALEKGQFLLHYQAQIVGENSLAGVEALVRWQHPTRKLVSPAEFIPLAEETGLIKPLGLWVLETACTRLAAWALQPQMEHLTIAVNVSAQQFRDPGFVDQVLAVLSRTGADPGKLKLELTESLLVDSVQDTIEKMFALKARRVGFSLDDFGTGYSSLAYLKRLPLDQLKIDQSFVRDVLSDANDAAIARTIIALAQSLGLAVIAEGVETAVQRDFLASAGCHAYQGYFFARPMPLEEFERFAAQR